MSTIENEAQGAEIPSTASNYEPSPTLGAEVLAPKEALQILQAYHNANVDYHDPAAEKLTPDATIQGAFDLTDSLGVVTTFKPDGTGYSISSTSGLERNFNWKELDNNSIELDYQDTSQSIFHSDGSDKTTDPLGIVTSEDGSLQSTSPQANVCFGSGGSFGIAAVGKTKNHKGTTEVVVDGNTYDFNKDGTGTIKGAIQGGFTYSLDASGGYHIIMNDQSYRMYVNLKERTDEWEWAANKNGQCNYT